MLRCVVCGNITDNESIVNCQKCGGMLEKIDSPSSLVPYFQENQFQSSVKLPSNQLFCPRCGSPILQGISQCPNCGFGLPNIPSQNSNSSFPNSSGLHTENKMIFCPKYLSGETKCKKCGAKLKAPSAKTFHTHDTESRKISIIRLVLSIVMAAFILYEMFQAADNVLQGGKDIMGIESVGGKTLEEAYYFYLGKVYNGYATVIRMLGVFFASVLVMLGLQKQ